MLMSENNLSPMNYLSKTFGEVCQDLGLNPQEVMNLLVFAFLQTPEEGRLKRMGQLKVLYNEFSKEADFKQVLETINGAIETAELKLHDWLLERTERPTVVDFAPQNQPESGQPDESVESTEEV
jgi:hypothetical protein